MIRARLSCVDVRERDVVVYWGRFVARQAVAAVVVAIAMASIGLLSRLPGVVILDGTILVLAAVFLWLSWMFWEAIYLVFQVLRLANRTAMSSDN